MLPKLRAYRRWGMHDKLGPTEIFARLQLFDSSQLDFLELHPVQRNNNISPSIRHHHGQETLKKENPRGRQQPCHADSY